MNHRGFTLIELMIVVAVVGILAAIAYPSYQEQVRKSRRADAAAVLMRNAQILERVYTETGSYSADAPLLPKSPIDGDETYYDMTPADGAITATGFTLQAVPAGPQAGDKCGTLTLTHVGQQNVASAASGITSEHCW